MLRTPLAATAAGTLLWAGCSSPQPQLASQPAIAAHSAAPLRAVPAPERPKENEINPAPSAPVPVTPTAFRQLSRRGIKLGILTFDRRDFQLSVLDNAAGPGTGATSARQAASTTGAVAAINGGFFTPQGSPLGLVVERGIRHGSLNHSSLGSGVFYRDQGDAPRNTGLVRRETWQNRNATGLPDSLLQSGPFLVEQGKRVPGLSTAKSRPRSFLAWDGRNGWAIGYADSCSLSQLASLLAEQSIPGLAVHQALNLDGGSSSDLWVSDTVKGGPASLRPFWNKPARNYLVLNPAAPRSRAP